MALKKVFEPFPWKELAPSPIIGVDEVGRGCLAGPVFAAAVILPEEFDLPGLTDSKKLSEKKREQLSVLIHEQAQVSIAFASVEEIDRINILKASLLAMLRAIQGLGIKESHVLVDGNQKVPGWSGPQTTLVKGDLRAAPVAAASIVAKVARDHLMMAMAEEFPGFGFEVHKGYGTPVHREAIVKLGAQAVHRKSFSGVKEYIYSSDGPSL